MRLTYVNQQEKKQSMALPGRHHSAEIIHYLRGKRDKASADLLAQLVWLHVTNEKRQKEGKPMWGVICRKDGLRYIANKQADWAHQCNNSSVDQYKRARQILVGLDLIEVRIMRSHGTPLTHIRIKPERVEAEFKAWETWDANGKPGKVSGAGKKKNPQMGLEGNPPNLCTTETRSETLEIKDTLDRALTSADEEDHRQQEEIGREEEKKIELNSVPVLDQEQKEDGVHSVSTSVKVPAKIMTAQEILAKRQQEPLTTTNLGAHWLGRMKLVYPTTYQPSLTWKEQGQLKHLKKCVGLEDAKKILDYVITKWWHWASDTAAAEGISFPDTPHIGFIIKYHARAMNLLYPLHPSAKPPHPSGTVPTPTAPIVYTEPQPTPVETEPPVTLTEDELEALIKGLKE
jgi:hypothetical protein